MGGKAGVTLNCKGLTILKNKKSFLIKKKAFYLSVETVSPNIFISVTEGPILESAHNSVTNVNTEQR